MNKEDLELLKKISIYLRDIGLGKIYGNLGRMQAIVHNQLLNDNPSCYSIDKNGNRLIPNFNENDLMLLNELGSHIDDMLSHTNLYEDLENLIIKYEKL